MAKGGDDAEVFSQEFSDGFGLGWRLDDKQFWHIFIKPFYLVYFELVASKTHSTYHEVRLARFSRYALKLASNRTVLFTLNVNDSYDDTWAR